MGRQRVEKPRGLGLGHSAMVHLRLGRVVAKVDHGLSLTHVSCTPAHLTANPLPTIRDGQLFLPPPCRRPWGNPSKAWRSSSYSGRSNHGSGGRGGRQGSLAGAGRSGGRGSLTGPTRSARSDPTTSRNRWLPSPPP